MALTFLPSINKKFHSYLKENSIIPRKDASQGVWLSFLLPLAVVLGELKYKDTSYTYKTAASISFGFLAHSLIIVMQARKNVFLNLYSLIVPCCLSTMLLFYFTLEGLLLSIIYGVTIIPTYQVVILPFMKLCSKSFTFGEATICLQGLFLFLVCCLVRKKQRTLVNCMEASTVILQVGIASLTAMAYISYWQNLKNKPKEFYFLVVMIIAVLLLPALHFLLGEFPVTWILNKLIEDNLTIMLVSFWSFCSFLGVVALVIQVITNRKANTVDRKIFHVLSVVVFTPGIIFKPCLLYLCSGVVFGIFLAIEMLRNLNIPPFADFLQSAFLQFSDEKDEGPIAFTPIYLLVGCSLPLWINPSPEQSELLPLLAGLLSIGIGDTAASVCGTYFGRNKWPGSKKTKEGSAACFLSQLFTVIALIHFEYIPRTNLIKPTFSIALISIIEAKTDQIDNIALPLVMYICTL